MDFSPLGSSVHGIFQARILEYSYCVAISYCGGSSQPRDRTCITCISYIGRLVFYQLHHLGSMHMCHRIPNVEKSSDRAWPITVYIWGNYNVLQLNEIVQWHNDRQKSWGQKLGFLISKLVLFLLLYFIAHCQVGTKNSIQQILTVFPYMPSTGLCSGIQKKCKRRVLPKKNFWAHWENRAHTHTKQIYCLTLLCNCRAKAELIKLPMMEHFSVFAVQHSGQ